MTDTPMITHWEGCESEHHACALAKLAALQEMVGRLETELCDRGKNLGFMTSDRRSLLEELENIVLFLHSENANAAALVVEDAARHIKNMGLQALAVFGAMNLEAGELKCDLDAERGSAAVLKAIDRGDVIISRQSDGWYAIDQHQHRPWQCYDSLFDAVKAALSGDAKEGERG